MADSPSLTTSFRRRVAFHLKGQSTEDGEVHDVVLDEDEQDQVIASISMQSYASDYRGAMVAILATALLFFLINPPPSEIASLPAYSMVGFALALATLSVVASLVLSLQPPVESPSTPRPSPKRPNLHRALSLPPELAHTVPYLNLGPLLPISFTTTALVATIYGVAWYRGLLGLPIFVGWTLPAALIGLAWLVRRAVEGSQAEIEGLARLKYAYKGA